MKYLKIFEQWHHFDYDKIVSILNKTQGWGGGILQYVDEFENSEYFLTPVDEHQYSDQFHIFLTDKFRGKNRGWIKTPPLPLGKWKVGPTVMSPTSWYSKST